MISGTISNVLTLVSLSFLYWIVFIVVFADCAFYPFVFCSLACKIHISCIFRIKKFCYSRNDVATTTGIKKNEGKNKKHACNEDQNRKKEEETGRWDMKCNTMTKSGRDT